MVVNPRYRDKRDVAGGQDNKECAGPNNRGYFSCSEKQSGSVASTGDHMDLLYLLAKHKAQLPKTAPWVRSAGATLYILSVRDTFNPKNSPLTRLGFFYFYFQCYRSVPLSVACWMAISLSGNSNSRGLIPVGQRPKA